MSRSLRCISLSFAALVLTASPPAQCSWFGKGLPVPQWGLDAAKLHTPAYANDSSSVILFDEYIETVDAQGRALERERKAVRILKPHGRDTGCEVSYDETQKINYFRVWTIGADEKQYQAQDTDFVEHGDTEIPVMLSSRKVRVAHPPATDVGAVVICESEELMEPYLQEKVWFLQGSTPVVSEALEIDLPAGRSETSSWHNHEPVNPVEVTPGHWRWELKDIPALTLRDIPSAPDRGALSARMSVQWGDAAVEGTDNQWRAIGQWITALEANRPDPSPEITAKVQSLVAGAPTFYTKLSRITESIQSDIRYFVVTRGIGGLQANHAGDIYRNRYGDCKDKATLLISMLQVASIHAYYVPVDTRRGFVDPANPSLAGDHMITAIEIPADVEDPHLRAIVTGKDGRRYLIFDPTDERTPVGNLRSDLQGGYGTLVAGPASQVIALPVLPPDANATERKGNFALAADGTLTGLVESLHSGPGGTDVKYFGEKERREAIEKVVVHDVPGAVIDSFKYVQPPELDKPVEIHYQFTAAQYAHQAGPVVLLRPRVVGSHVLCIDDKPRTVPIDLGATGRWHDSYDITLPAGLVVDETPDPVDLDVDFASYRSSVTVKGNLLHYEREYIVRQVQIPAEKAAAFRKLEGVILGDEKGTAVLKRG
jgi:transglutaminase-like putative cysteine protease